ncbi:MULTISPECIES: hypothetical protein [Clostridia]|nr:hypothetical protein [Eubacterium sp. AF22-9]
MKIGIFDSGIGGLSVLHQAMITMPELITYFMLMWIMFHMGRKQGKK